MGNKIAKTTQASATEYYLHDLPSSYNLVLKEVLGRGRFLKSILCKHDEGLVLVKVYFKRGDSIDLREYERRLAQIRDVVTALDHPHVWPFQFWLETDKAAYLLRQYFFNNLHDRLSTRPFLSLVEKKWLSFQLLYAVKQIHDRGICHGDIKCENVLVTSWNWLYLADFASFKPTYIPHDDPSDFSFFFDTGGRRRCYLAPERFYEHLGEKVVVQDARLKPSMDIFSVGCVIAELFLEGQPLFELSQLLAYRRGQYDPSQYLEKIPDSGIRDLILHMIQLEPESRFSAESYLQNFSGVVFPSYFSPFLHNFYSSLNSLNSDARVLICQTSFGEILRQMMSNTPGNRTCSRQSNSLGATDSSLVGADPKPSGPEKDSLRNEKDMDEGTMHDRFDLLGDVSDLLRGGKKNHCCYVTNQMLEDVSDSTYFRSRKQHDLQSPDELIQCISNRFNRSQHPFLKKISMVDLASLMSDYDNQSDTFGLPSLPLPQDIISCEGMVLIASLLCSSIRNVKLPFMRRVAVLLLKSCSLYIDDDDRLQRVLPYVIAMLSDPAAIVRCAALETLCDILPLVRDFPPSDAKIFPEYILPMLSMLPDDPEESVRIWYACNMSKLALTAYGFLIHSISLSEAGVLNESNLLLKTNIPSKDRSERPESTKNMAQLAHLRTSIAEIVQELVMGPKQTPNIRRALLLDIGNLCWFFGQRQSNDFLLPILPAFLNDRDEQLRAVFYGQITYVCFFVGCQSVEEYLLPYIEQALTDVSEAVIVNALDCLAILCKSGFLRKRILLDMIEHAFPLLCYPSQWVRKAAVTFIAASSESLGAVDSYVFLAPVIRPFLRRQPASLASEKVLLSCLKAPVAREVFYHVLENARSSDMLERQRKIWYNTSSQSKQLESLDILQSPRELDQMKGLSDGQNNICTNKAAADENETLALSNYADYRSNTKAPGNVIRNASYGIESGDNLESEKLRLSGFMSPQLSGMKSLIEKSSEGVPLYYFKVDNKQTKGPSAASDSLPYSSLGFGSSSLPFMDHVNKSFSLASSVPAPRLVSGSISIGSSSTQLRRVVHEVEDRENDQATVTNSKFLELGASAMSKGSPSTLGSASVSTEDAEVPSYARAFAFPDSGWRPRGVLVAHLQEHRSAVNDIAVSTDNSFFVSASDDSTVKLWDSKRLEKDISFRSRLTYSLEGSRALCVQVLQGSTQVVVGTCDGTIHMFSVDHMSKGQGNVIDRYSGIADIKKHGTGEGAIPSLLSYSPDGGYRKMILYSTQNCRIHLWDTRTSSYAWNTKVVPEEGYINSLVADPCGNWFVSGSSRGVLTLWDLRFCIPVNSWQYSLACPIERMCPFVPPVNSSFSAATRPLVYVAAGCNEVSLWNAENGSCHQVLRLANTGSDVENSDSPGALARLSSKANAKSDLRLNVNSQYRINELNEHPPRLPGIRSLLPLPGGDLLTGGSDLKIRRWDHSSPDRSYCVCGPSVKGVGNDDFYETKSSFGVQVVQESRRRPLSTRLTAKAILSGAAVDLAGCHRDCILSLASVKQNQRLLLSGSRDGAIKVWK